MSLFCWAHNSRLAILSQKSNDVILLFFGFHCCCWEFCFHSNCSSTFSNLSLLFYFFQDQDLFALVFCGLVAVFLDRIYFYLFYLAYIVLPRSMDSFLEKLGLRVSNSGHFRPVSFWIYISSMLSILLGFQLNSGRSSHSVLCVSYLLVCPLISAAVLINSLASSSGSLHLCLNCCLIHPLIFNFNS